MKYQNLLNRYNNLEKEIKEALKTEINKSKTKSKHIDSNAIKVNVFDYEELVIINSKLTFLDAEGLHYSIYCECELTDLIDILKNI